MGRKIPAKKHRGVKDPHAQQAKRWQSIKGKINTPPKDPDDQPVPKSLLNLFNPHNLKSKSTKRKKKREINGSSAYSSASERNIQNPVSQLRRLPGESGRSFSLRINGAIRALNDSADELHYPVDNEHDDVKGERMAEQRRRRERKRRRNKEPQAQEADATKLTRGQRLTLKKKAKKLKQTQEVEAREVREVQYERVGFGEVAHAPPALPALRSRRGGAAAQAPAAGWRGLLLSGAGALQAAERERARLEAVHAYRALRRAAPPSATPPVAAPPVATPPVATPPLRHTAETKRAVNKVQRSRPLQRINKLS